MRDPVVAEGSRPKDPASRVRSRVQTYGNH